MSGGSFDYMCYKVQETYGGRMLDTVLDYGEDTYRRTVEWFKTKWIGKPAPILRDVVEQEMQNMRKRLLTAVAWTDGGDRE